jgi:hypothetical protein
MRFSFKNISAIWQVDLRSLALFRMGLGLLVLADLYLRFQPEFFEAFHTDDGVLPRSFLIDKVGDAWRLTPHLMSGTSAGIGLLFAIQAFFGCMLLIGWHTRFMTLACWVLTLGLQNRNPMVIQGGDVFFRLLLLVGVFLPLNARFSVDRLLLPDSKESERALADPRVTISTAASLFLTLQVISVYIFSGLIKYGDQSWRDGLGVYYSLATYQFATELGVALSHHQGLMFISNWIILAVEIAVPFLVFLPPSRFGLVRFLTVCTLMAFHLGIVALLFVGLFPWIGIVAWMPLIPSWFWEKVSTRMPKADWHGYTLYYNQTCAPCHRIGVYLSRLVGLPRTQVQSTSHPGGDVQLAASWSLACHDLHDRTMCVDTAVSRCLVSRALLPWRTHRALRWVILPIHACAWTVATISSVVLKTPLKRYVVPNFRSARVLYGGSLLSQIVCLLGCWIALEFNLSSVPQLGYSSWVKQNNWVHLLGLDQQWAMFSRPFVDDGWFVFPGKLASGADIDVFRDGAPVSFEPPQLIAATYKGDRWRKYMTNVWSTANEKHRLPFGRYLCRTWNSSHPESERLETYEMVYMRQDTLPNGTKAPVQRVMIWRHECFDGMLEKWKKKEPNS